MTKKKILISTKLRKPSIEISETHSIGWWSKQHALTVDTFEVEIIESKLNLFNNKSLIKYRIKGGLNYQKGWKPFIKEIHISERFVTQPKDSIENTTEAIIELTPIIGSKKDKNYNGDKIEFDITNEKIVNSFHWGDNRLRLKCLDHVAYVILSQWK